MKESSGLYPPSGSGWALPGLTGGGPLPPSLRGLSAAPGGVGGHLPRHRVRALAWIFHGGDGLPLRNHRLVILIVVSGVWPGWVPDCRVGRYSFQGRRDVVMVINIWRAAP